jgi:segregation and condensation protein B
VLATVHLAKRTVWSLTEARASLERLVGMAEDWSRLDEYLLSYVVDPSQRATVFASSFAAALELVREGEMELHQKEAFAPLYFRKRPPQPPHAMPRRICRSSKWKKETEPWQAWRKNAWKMPRTIPIRKRGRRNCGCWKRCCSPPPSRSIRRRWPSGCPTASTSRRRWRNAGGIRPRGVNLVRVANKWTFRTAGDLSWLMTRESTETRRLSRAAIEMLAIIAYHQPVTRAEIEEIRGVITSKGTLDVLLETGWIRPRGRRKTPGRPLTFGTTEAFLSQFSLEALGDLPGLEELKGTGLLDSRLPAGFSVPTPSDDPALARGRGSAGAGDLELAAGAGRRAGKGRRKLSSEALRRGPRNSRLTVAAIRSRDSDLPRLKSLFLTPPGPTFRQSLGRIAGRRVLEGCRMGSLSIWHWIVVIAVVLLLFGRGKISDLMGDVAQGIKAFKKGMQDDDKTAEKPEP